MQALDTIGRAEQIDVLDFDLRGIPAKVDTGADSSSIWASQISEQPDGLRWVFFGPESPYYSGQVVHIGRSYSAIRIVNSFGETERRYKVRLRVSVKGRIIRATFTLADRSRNTYPALLGRRLLKGKFLVDVSRADPSCTTEELKARRVDSSSIPHAKRGKKL